MTLSDPDKLAVIEIILYAPILLLTLLVLFRLRSSSDRRTWISLSILCALRVAGGGVQLATIKHSTDKNLYEWAAILSSVGLSALFFATIGTLTRLEEGLDKVYRHPLGLTANIHNLLLQLGTTASVVLIIVGGVKGGSNLGKDGVFDIDGAFKAGVIVLIVVFAGFCDSSIFTFIYRRYGPLQVGELFLAFYASLPFIFVRLIYVCLTAFSHLSKFNIAAGSTWVRFGMTVVMEIIVAIMYLSAGLISSFRRPRTL